MIRRRLMRHWGLPAAAAALAALLSAQPAAAALVQIDTTYAGQTKAINVSTAATVEIVAAVSGKKIHITHWDVISAGSTNMTWAYGTGVNCGTGQVLLTGAYPWTAQAGISPGNGTGSVLEIPASNALCIVNSAAVLVAGSLTFMQAP